MKRGMLSASLRCIGLLALIAALAGALPRPAVAESADIATDGRINWDSSHAGPVALYCDGKVLQVYDIDPETGKGRLAFAVEFNFPKGYDTTYIMRAFHDIELWHLSTDEYQVSADAGEGKTYAFVFNGCPYDGNGYNVNVDPNE